MSDTQIIHQMLSQLGIKLTMHWSRSHPGYRGEKLRVYSLDIAHWKQVWTILQKRQQKRQQLQQQRLEMELRAGSPAASEVQDLAGDPGAATSVLNDPWLTEEILSDVQGWIAAAGGNPEVLAAIHQMIPDYVWQRLVFR